MLETTDNTLISPTMGRQNTDNTLPQRNKASTDGGLSPTHVVGGFLGRGRAFLHVVGGSGQLQNLFCVVGGF